MVINLLKNYKIILVCILAFIIRLIPSRNFAFPGNDAYIHHDIVMRLATKGIGILSKNPTSLLGLKPYAYPPLYHILGLLMYKIFNSQLVFFILPPLLAILTILIFYKIAWEIFENERDSILSAFLFSIVPSFVARTSVFIPESLGILLFTIILYLLIKYVKSIPGYSDIDNFSLGRFFKVFKGNPKYIIIALLILSMYLFTHRGWVFLAITVLILILTFLIPSFKKRPIEVSILFFLAAVGILEFTLFTARLQTQPVTILGFPKWIGLIQLIFGLYGALFFMKSKNPIYKFILLWFAVFAIVGTYSFRFRDPYAAIPLSLMAGYGLSQAIIRLDNVKIPDYRILKKDITPYIRLFVISLFLIIPIAQGGVIAYLNVISPTPEQVEAFEWIEKNTAPDSVFLATMDDAYLLIGNTHRKDVLLWKTIYQGMMGNPPTLKEKEMSEMEVKTIFTTSQPNEAYYFIEKNNITYIYIRKTMHQQGLGLYLPTDTHFKTLLVTGDVAVYQYIPNPPIEGNKSKINFTGNPEYEKITHFIEKFWNGYSYSEIGEYTPIEYDPARDLEFGSTFKGCYDSNAMIAALYDKLAAKTGNTQFKERSDYLIKWLEYKQMENGSFPGGMPPAEYTITTAQTIYPLKDLKTNETEKITNKGLQFIENQINNEDIKIAANKESSQFIGPDYLKLKTESQVGGMKPDKEIIYNVIEKQRGDGSWTSAPYENIEILKGLTLYYLATNDTKALKSIQEGSKWLKANQEYDGKFKGDGDPEIYSIGHYADAILVYYVAGDKEAMEKTLNYTLKKNIENDPIPLKSYLTLFWDLKIIYNEDTALELSSKIL